MNSYVFWQNTPSLHVAPMVAALAAQHGVEVSVVTEFDLPASRRNLGWDLPDFGTASVHVAPTPQERIDLEGRLGPHGRHVFWSLGSYPLTRMSMRRVARLSPRRMAVLSEPWDPRGLKGGVRRLRYRRLVRDLPDTVDTHLLMGRHARDQWRALGVPEQSIFPFSYSVSMPSGIAVRQTQETSILFVGSLDNRKGVGTLLDAVTNSDILDSASLTIIGTGPKEKEFRLKASRSRQAANIRFAGVVSNSEARTAMVRADVLVLPSVFDGWGAVVNEALLAGTYAITSDEVGAADLLGPSRGSVFRAGHAEELGELLRFVFATGAHLDKASRQRWAQQSIGPEALANYLVLVMDREPNVPPPSAPWLN